MPSTPKFLFLLSTFLFLVLTTTSAQSDPQLHIRGSMNHWQPDLPLTATDSTYHVEVTLLSGTHEFRIADAAWTLETNYGLQHTTDQLTPQTPIRLKPAGENIHLDLARAGRYRLELDRSDRVNPTLHLSVVDAALAARIASPIYLRGTMNDWQPTPEFELKPTTDGIYELSVALRPDIYEFKIADADWQPLSQFGAGATHSAIRPGESIAVQPSQRNLMLITLPGLNSAQVEPAHPHQPIDLHFRLDVRDPLAPTLQVDGGEVPTRIVPLSERLAAYAVLDSSVRQIQSEVFYFMLLDRFENGDPGNDYAGADPSDFRAHGFDPTNGRFYHGGDLQGLKQRLDYISNLGATAIWMTPIFTNKVLQYDDQVSGYHGYWITDFMAVDPHLGTEADLQTLIDAAHERGLKVYLDIVLNHTADVIYYDCKPCPYRAEGYAPHRPIPAIKNPAWLNDPDNYHNRGETSDWQAFGEQLETGDLAGLDDLDTTQPDVIAGLIAIHEHWLANYDIDGYRIDTVKHVDLAFWQTFAEAMREAAARHERPQFFMFGEAMLQGAESNQLFRYTTEGDLPSVLDFGLQERIRQVISQGQSTHVLRQWFARDSVFADANSDAYQLMNFHGNHDIGRFGSFLRVDNPGATNAELLKRMQLADALLFLARGIPIIYYGDEQGFTGSRDFFGREDMFPSQTPDYQRQPQLGTEATPAADNFDATHPLYRGVQTLARLGREHPALWRGVQIECLSQDRAGLYGFLRLDPAEMVEYLIVLNVSPQAQQATLQTYTPDATYQPLFPADAATIATDSAAMVTVQVPGLGYAVYRADRAVRE